MTDHPPEKVDPRPYLRLKKSKDKTLHLEIFHRVGNHCMSTTVCVVQLDRALRFLESTDVHQHVFVTLPPPVGSAHE